MTSLVLSTKSGNARSMILKIKGLVELTLKSSYKYNKENQMKNLNSSYTQSIINLNNDIHFKLNSLLVACKNCNTDISHVYLTEKDASFLTRNISTLHYYQHSFNDLGVELVCPIARKETI